MLQLNFDFGKENQLQHHHFEIPPRLVVGSFWKYNLVDWIDVRGQNDIPIIDGGSVYTWSNFGGWVSLAKVSNLGKVTSTNLQRIQTFM